MKASLAFHMFTVRRLNNEADFT